MVKRLTSLRCPRRSTAPRASSLETSLSDATISICSLSSSVRPCAACTASSTVGGSRRTRRRPSFVSHMSLISHLFVITQSVLLSSSLGLTLAYKTYYQGFAAMQQENCAAHSRGFQQL